MSENRKIVLAGFIGGALGTFTSFSVSPNFWWLGIIVGFCASYVAYDFLP